MSDNHNELLSSKIDAGVKAAIAEAIERHRRLGQSISIMRDGKIVTLRGEEIPATTTETNAKDQD